MKIKTAVFKELHGKLERPFLGGMTCFRTDKYGNIVGLKSPSEPRIPSKKQPLYRHQIRYWSLHWNFLTPAQKQTYQVLGDAEDITGYNYYMREKYDVNTLYMAPTDNRWVELWSPDKHPTVEEYLHMSDDEDFEDWIYINFPLEKISKTQEINRAQLWLNYAGEAGSDARLKRVDVYRVLEPWSENTITYNTRPTTTVSRTGSGFMPDIGYWLRITVTSDIELMISSGVLFYGWMVKFHDTVSSGESYAGMRSALPHDDDAWPYLKLEL